MKGEYVYALIDPRTKEFRYIGYTSDPKGRHSSHCSTSSGHTPREKWLAELKRLSIKPEMVILHECKNGEWGRDIERELIKRYRVEGHPLTNGHNGHIPRSTKNVAISVGEDTKCKISDFIDAHEISTGEKIDTWDVVRAAIDLYVASKKKPAQKEEV